MLLSVIIVSSSLLSFRELKETADNIISALTIVKDPLFDSTGRPRPQIDLPPSISLETPYESRYFIVTLSETDESVLNVNIENIVSVSSDTAVELAYSALDHDKTEGFLEDFRYNIIREDGTITIVCLEYSQYLANFRTSTLYTCIISLVCFAVVVVLLILFSGNLVKPLAESDAKQRQFITAAGHEIKTPLTIIDADAEVLSMDLGENEWLQDIQLQTQRLARLTNDLIRLSRMDEGNEQFQMIDFPVSDIVAETASSFQNLAHGNGLELICNVQPDLSLNGDESAIRQLVSILLDNAIKYGNNNAPITLSLSLQVPGICLYVSNAADSVTQEQMGRFFDRFIRTESSRNSEKGGYGLGLAIAKSIVEAHKGKISVSSTGPGLIQVTVLLP